MGKWLERVKRVYRVSTQTDTAVSLTSRLWWLAKVLGGSGLVASVAATILDAMLNWSFFPLFFASMAITLLAIVVSSGIALAHAHDRQRIRNVSAPTSSETQGTADDLPSLSDLQRWQKFINEYEIAADSAAPLAHINLIYESEYAEMEPYLSDDIRARVRGTNAFGLINALKGDPSVAIKKLINRDLEVMRRKVFKADPWSDEKGYFQIPPNPESAGQASNTPNIEQVREWKRGLLDAGDDPLSGVAYIELRPYLPLDVVKDLESGFIIRGPPGGVSMDWRTHWILQELDKLMIRWGLTPSTPDTEARSDQESEGEHPET